MKKIEREISTILAQAKQEISTIGSDLEKRADALSKAAPKELATDLEALRDKIHEVVTLWQERTC